LEVSRVTDEDFDLSPSFDELVGMLRNRELVRLVNAQRQAWDSVDEPTLAAAIQRWLVPALAGSTFDAWSRVAGARTVADSLFNLAVLIWRTSEYETDAVETLRLADRQGSEDAASVLAEYLLWLDNPQAAVEILDRIIRDREPGISRAQLLLGRYYAEELRRSDEETHALLTAAVQSEPEAYVPLARVERSNGHIAEAARLLEIAAASGNPDAAVKLGNLYLDDLDDRVAAETAYRVGVELGDPYSAYNLGRLLDSVGRTSESMSLYRLGAAGGDSNAATRLQQLGK
jgi:TPR repeat protein